MEGALLARELQVLVHEAVESLPPQQKMVYKLSREQGMDRREVAETLHLSQNTVKNHLTLATQFIRSFLLKKGVLLWVVVAGLLPGEIFFPPDWYR